MRAALLQLTSPDDPAAARDAVLPLLAAAKAEGADAAFTPEVTNCVSLSRSRQAEVLRDEEDDATLAALRDAAAKLGLWVSIGSLALKGGDRFVNRSFLIGPDGAIAARYDKIHMFDVAISDTERFEESAAFRPGDTAVVARTPIAKFGLSICYDLRFPHLYRRLAVAGADVLLVPSAFSPVTGRAHWEPLLQARAIETGCFVIAAAQTGRHPVAEGRPRTTHGHSMVVAPWGDVLLDAGTEPGLHLVDLDLSQVAEARARLPALVHDRVFKGP